MGKQRRYGRKLSCKVCGEKWHPAHATQPRYPGDNRRGTSVIDFYEEHERRHGLTEPHREEGETDMDYVYRLEEWRRQYFEDTNLENY
jgi:hypothetical protein